MVLKRVSAIIFALVLAAIALMLVAKTSSAQDTWIPCPNPRVVDEGVYIWGKAFVEETCVYTTQSILDLDQVLRLQPKVEFVCETNPDEWLIVFYSEANLEGDSVEFANCGKTKFSWQPKSVLVDRIEHIPPDVSLPRRQIFLPVSHNMR